MVVNRFLLPLNITQLSYCNAQSKLKVEGTWDRKERH